MEAQGIKTLLYNTSVHFLFPFTETVRKAAATDLIRSDSENELQILRSHPGPHLLAVLTVFPWAELSAVPEDLFILTNAFYTLHSAYCMVVPFEDM